ncbi:MAG: DUF5320 domain-containing protein [Syntrophales bacterium]|nr:DUF5320 domain-containing protein [Syntrophales bacterium]
MPRGNRTGPTGAGAMTGRGLGFCAGYDRPGYANMMGPGHAGGWYGRGRGFGGGGCGRRLGFAATGRPGWMRFGDYGAPYGSWAPYPQADPEVEKQTLKAQADLMQSELDRVRKRLDEIDTAKNP